MKGGDLRDIEDGKVEIYGMKGGDLRDKSRGKVKRFFLTISTRSGSMQNNDIHSLWNWNN